MLTDRDKEIVQRTWRLVLPIRETAADLFYDRLFKIQPSYRPLFKSDLGAQKRKLVTMLAFVVKSLDWRMDRWNDEIDEEDDLFLVVLAMGRRHAELYAVPDEAYDAVGEALIWTLDYGLGEAFTDEARQAWLRVYTLLANTMKMGHGAADLGEPVTPLHWDEMDKMDA